MPARSAQRFCGSRTGSGRHRLAQRARSRSPRSCAGIERNCGPPLMIGNLYGQTSVAPRADWNVLFAPGDCLPLPGARTTNLWAERAGIDGANLRWTVQHQPAIGYQVWLNGKEMAFSPTLVCRAFAGTGSGRELTSGRTVGETDDYQRDAAST